MSQLLSVRDVAKRLSCSPNTVYRLISDGELRTVDIGRDGRARTRVREDDLDEWIDKNTRSASRLRSTA